jgi:hypothetical protein
MHFSFVFVCCFFFLSGRKAAQTIRAAEFRIDRYSILLQELLILHMKVLFLSNFFGSRGQIKGRVMTDPA